jgi:hypothetical protein
MIGTAEDVIIKKNCQSQCFFFNTNKKGYWLSSCATSKVENSNYSVSR